MKRRRFYTLCSLGFSLVAVSVLIGFTVNDESAKTIGYVLGLIGLAALYWLRYKVFNQGGGLHD